MRNFNKDDYVEVGRWLTPTLAWVPWMYWGKGVAIRKLGLPETGEYVMFDGHGFWDKRTVSKIQSRCREELEKGNYDYFAPWFAETDTAIEHGQKFGDDKGTIESKGKYFVSFMDWYASVCPNWQLVFLFEDVIQEAIENERVNAELSPADVAPHLKPIKPTLIMQEHASVKALRKKQDKGLDIEEDIKRHLKEFEWVGTHHFWGDPLTEERIRQELVDKVSGDEVATGDLPQEFPEPFKNLVRFAQKVIWLRTYCAEISDVVSFKMRPVMADIAAAIGISYDEVIWLTTQEIVSDIKIEEAHKLIRGRKTKYGMYLNGNTLVVVTGRDVDIGLEELLGENKNTSDIQEIRGKVGNEGYARGIVKIMLTPENSKSFPDRGILVASETTPDFVPMMKRAAAFITNQGGITSHAAIIAREFGKPCIIGTKIATKILKDGDLVEVDAEKGIVRILEKTQR